jgi:hypothetical protein
VYLESLATLAGETATEKMSPSLIDADPEVKARAKSKN